MLDTLPEEKMRAPSVLIIAQREPILPYIFLKNLAKAISMNLTSAALFDLQTLEKQNLLDYFLHILRLALDYCSRQL